MANSKNASKKAPTDLVRSAEKVLDILSAIRLFFSGLKESIAGHWDWLLRRMEYLFFVYVWASIGLLLMVLGIFDLLIEFCRIPRGVVFSLGGLLIFLVAVIFLQAAKIKKTRK